MNAHCNHCGVDIPPGYKSTPVGRHRVCYGCKDAYLLARINQLEAGLSTIITKTKGTASHLATQLLYGNGHL